MQIFLIGTISLAASILWKKNDWHNFFSNRAAECTDSYEQMAFVAAFTVSSYATTAARTGKPFNPLLGETYECDRTDDLGWRAISEQVSHHPPMLAQHCEGKKWRCWQEFTMASKFRGKYLQVKCLPRWKRVPNHRSSLKWLHNQIVFLTTAILRIECCLLGDSLGYRSFRI